MSRAAGLSRRAEIGVAAAVVLRGCAPLPVATSDLAHLLGLPPIDQAQYLLYELHRMVKRGEVELVTERGRYPSPWGHVWAWIP